MTSFFMLEVQPLVSKTQTMKLHEILNWSEIATQLVGLYRREVSGAGGPEPYAPLSMFKAMLLGQWHGLSDSELEHALKVRLDFMVFTGFEPGGVGFPDASTICRFRSRLVKAQLDQRLLAVINEQLRRAGLMVEQATGAVIDATIIASAARPNGHLDVGEQGQAQPVTSADAEATWTKKAGKAYYGYRGYAVVDSEDGYVQHCQVHPANEAEVKKLPEIVKALIRTKRKPLGLLADKGYASAQNRQYLKRRKIKDFIQHKASRGHPLKEWQSRMNKLIGTVRFKVEQAFGTMKRQFGLSRARYMGVAKVQAQMVWAALGLNLLKAHRKLQSMQRQSPVGVGAS